MTRTAIDEFRERLASRWVPSFSAAHAHRDFAPEGFRWETATRLKEYDARWFLAAVDAGLVTESGGFFVAAMSPHTEQLFWSGSKSESPRTFTLWLEPIITIGALARLHFDHGWPADRLGCQSKGSGLDLVGYDPADNWVLGGEVKNTQRELDALIVDMARFAADPGLTRPENQRLRNALKKVVSIRKNKPSTFWAIAAEGYSRAFRVVRLDGAGRFALQKTPAARLDPEA